MGKAFISYRRIDKDFAHRLACRLNDFLIADIFIDLNIRQADFEVALEYELQTCDVFILVLTAHTFDAQRIGQRGDWVRREVATALKLKKPIAIAQYENYPLPITRKLPPDIQSITRMQAIPVYTDYFDEGVFRLARHVAEISGHALGLDSGGNAGKLNTIYNLPGLPRWEPMPTYEETQLTRGFLRRVWNRLFED